MEVRKSITDFGPPTGPDAVSAGPTDTEALTGAGGRRNRRRRRRSSHPAGMLLADAVGACGARRMLPVTLWMDRWTSGRVSYCRARFSSAS